MLDDARICCQSPHAREVEANTAAEDGDETYKVVRIFK